MYRFSARSYRNLAGVRPELVAVATLALLLTDVDFVVTEGVRTVERQRKLVASGASKTMRSRHLTGHAIDVAAWVDGDIRWDWPLYSKIAQAFKAAAGELGVKVTWGGTWRELNADGNLSMDELHKRFPDGPHYQVD